MNTSNGSGDAGQGLAEDTPVFSEAVLADSTMGDKALQKEVIGLFSDQFGKPESFFADAHDLASWRFAAHSLRGSAAAIGALQVATLAGGMEHEGLPVVRQERQRKVAQLCLAVERYLAAVEHITG